MTSGTSIQASTDREVGSVLQGLLTKANLDVENKDVSVDSEAWFGFREYVNRLLDALQEVWLIHMPVAARNPILRVR